MSVIPALLLIVYVLDRQTDRQTDRQADRETDRERETNILYPRTKYCDTLAQACRGIII
jgi:hypothetical protein